MNVTRALGGLLALALAGCAEPPPLPVAPAAIPAWDSDFELGPFPVGFRTETLTRPGAAGARELTLSIWYPAVDAASGTAMTLADYFAAAVDEGQLTETVGLAEEQGFAAAMTGASDAIAEETARTALDRATLAISGASVRRGDFPIALWSSRHATVLAQVPLSEVLASHGFVVATVWSSDPPLAFLWEDHPEEDKVATIESHTGDLQEALAALRATPNVDGARVVVIAWSYGGQTAARLQERDEAVVGVIGLDANVVPARPEESLDLRRPLLYLVGSNTGNRGFERLESLDAPWIAVRFPELAHGSFNAMEGYLPAALGAETVFSWSQTGQVARDGYRALVEVVTTTARALAGLTDLAFSDLPDELGTTETLTPLEVTTSGAPGG